MSQEIKEQEQEEKDKVQKQYDSKFSKLVALMGGEENLRKVKVPKGSVTAIVNEMLKEHRQQTIDDFKAKAKAMIAKKIQFDQDVKKAEEECKKVKTEKMKLFNQEMDALFGLVEGLDALAAQYYTSLKSAVDYSEKKEMRTAAPDDKTKDETKG